MKKFPHFGLSLIGMFLFVLCVNQLNAQTLVKNFGFETAMESWVSDIEYQNPGSAAASSISTDYAFDGSKSVKLVKATNTQQINFQNDAFKDVQAGDIISYHVWVSAADYADVDIFQVFWQNTSGWTWNAKLHPATGITGGQWSTVMDTIPAYDPPLQRIGLQLNSKAGAKTKTTTIYVDGISIWRGGAPLPVELTSFTVNIVGNKVSLAWKTATETNNLGFEVQRSINNKDFAMIGFVKGSGTTAESHSYSYADNISASGKYYYRLKQTDLSGSFTYSDAAEVSTLPATYSLSQNYPNPFNPVTTINFSLPETGNIKLVLFDVLGNVVKEILSGNFEAGNHQVKLDASNLSSGIYFYRLEAGSFVNVKKLTLMK